MPTFPKYVANIISSQGKTVLEQQKLLIIGQKSGAGTSFPNDLVQDITSFTEIDALFGARTQLSNMLKLALNIFNSSNSRVLPQLNAIALADPSGDAAAGTLQLTGVPTLNGKLTVVAGSSVNYTFSVDVTTGESIASILSNLEGLINANPDIPIVASISPADTLKLTFAHIGLIGNDVPISVENTVAGLGTVLSPFAGGTGVPSLTLVFDTIENIRMQTIVAPSQFGRTYLDDFLEPRFNTGTNKLLDGTAVSTATDTFANLLTLVDPVRGLNNTRVIDTFGNRIIDTSIKKGGSIQEFDFNLSTIFGCVKALGLTTNSNISSLVSPSLANTDDTVGGIAIASLPYFNTRIPLEFAPVIPITENWTAEEQEEAEDRGLNLFTNQKDLDYLTMGPVVTAYKKNAQGQFDTTFKFQSFVDTEVTLREFFKVKLQEAFPQNRLGKGNTSSISSRATATQDSISSQLTLIYIELADPFLLVLNDSESLSEFESTKVVTINRATRSVDISMRVNIMSQLEAFNVTFSIDLN